LAGLSRSSIGRLAVSGYPGHIFVCKLRYGYGHQEYIEKLEILHSWYSDLNAYLPVMFKGKETEYKTKQYSQDGTKEKVSLYDLMEDVGNEIDTTYNSYNPIFEGQTCDTHEKTFIKALRGIKERLDVITAESKIIEGMKMDDTTEMLAG
jgi:hypothetical protein